MRHIWLWRCSLLQLAVPISYTMCHSPAYIYPEMDTCTKPTGRYLRLQSSVLYWGHVPKAIQLAEIFFDAISQNAHSFLAYNTFQVISWRNKTTLIPLLSPKVWKWWRNKTTLISLLSPKVWKQYHDQESGMVAGPGREIQLHEPHEHATQTPHSENTIPVPLHQVSLYVVGFPCKPFSTLNCNSKMFRDKNSKPLFQSIRNIRRMRPCATWLSFKGFEEPMDNWKSSILTMFF